MEILRQTRYGVATVRHITIEAQLLKKKAKDWYGVLTATNTMLQTKIINLA